mgnify:CR=1 FL=1
MGSMKINRKNLINFLYKQNHATKRKKINSYYKKEFINYFNYDYIISEINRYNLPYFNDWFHYGYIGFLHFILLVGTFKNTRKWYNFN